MIRLVRQNRFCSIFTPVHWFIFRNHIKRFNGVAKSKLDLLLFKNYKASFFYFLTLKSVKEAGQIKSTVMAVFELAAGVGSACQGRESFSLHFHFKIVLQPGDASD